MSVAVTLAVRYLLCMLFLPFSALDKMLNYKGAVAQAEELTRSVGPAAALIVIGVCVEILMPLCIITGAFDRLAAFIMAGYCGVTALLWKQFWKPGDFWAGSDSKGRSLFWDFLKNFSLAGGFLLITFSGASLMDVLQLPLSSTHPYSAQP